MVLTNLKSHVAAIDALVDAETVAAGLSPAMSSAKKAVQLLSIMAVGGINNTLQRLVDPTWAVYAELAADSASASFVTIASTGATIAVLFPTLLYALCMAAVCRCMCPLRCNRR